MVLKCFHLNPGTGGVGAFKGGDGVVREFLFRKPLTLSILTERRVFAPYGLQGTAPYLSHFYLFFGFVGCLCCVWVRRYSQAPPPLFSVFVFGGVFYCLLLVLVLVHVYQAQPL